MEYPEMMSRSIQSSEPIKRNIPRGKEEGGGYYLQLPVHEGKRGKSELERWMAVGTAFVFMHSRRNRKVLIHCAQGKDRSVAMAMAVVVIFCDMEFPLQWSDHFWRLPLDGLIQQHEDDDLYLCSGLPRGFIDDFTRGREGRDRLLAWVNEGLCGRPDDAPLATKETLRVALLLIQQDREKADPSRSTMQTLNRFFMSKSSYDMSELM